MFHPRAMPHCRKPDCVSEKKQGCCSTGAHIIVLNFLQPYGLSLFMLHWLAEELCCVCWEGGLCTVYASWSKKKPGFSFPPPFLVRAFLVQQEKDVWQKWIVLCGWTFCFSNFRVEWEQGWRQGRDRQTLRKLFGNIILRHHIPSVARIRIKKLPGRKKKGGGERMNDRERRCCWDPDTYHILPSCCKCCCLFFSFSILANLVLLPRHHYTATKQEWESSSGKVKW